MDNKEVLYQLYDIISDRKINPKQGSYTNYLFEKGLDKILKKVGEETAETIIAAKNNDKNEVIYELSDLLYHISVLLSEKQITWDDVFEELKKHGYNQTRIQKERLLPAQTAQNIKAGKSITLETLNKICIMCKLQPGDIVEVIPTEEEIIKYY